MISRIASSAAFVLFVTVVAVHAQDAQQARPQPARPPRAAVPAPTDAPQPTPVPAPVLVPGKPGELPKRVGKDINVQVELTITDQTGAAAPDKKVVSLIAVDNTVGRVRANAETTKPTLGRVGTNLNVDARPRLLDGDRILLELTLEYTPLRDSDVVRPTTLNESLTVLLTNGKPSTVSQAADPIADRRMTVEVKATIVK